MRWVFIGLLVLNAMYFAWNQFIRENEVLSPVALEPDGGDVAPIQLLTELREEQTSVLEKRSETRKCDVYGPFFSASDSRTFLRIVSEAGVEGREEQEEVRLKPYYWLYVEPFSTRDEAEALVNRLRGYQLNAELIIEGRYRNGVSLGNFEQDLEVERLLERLAAQQIEVSRIEKSRNYKQFWVVLEPGSEAIVKGELQARLVNQYPEIYHQQKVCKPVASSS